MKQLALTAAAAVLCAGTILAQAPKPATPAPPQAPAAKPKWVAPIKGVAEIGYLRPNTKVVKDEVVTIIKVKNLSTGAIAGLRVDEYWYDKGGNMLPGDSERLRQPLLPGETAEVELRTPRNPNMERNNYQFTHANGQIKAKLLAKM
jgi:hypothetical protein